jgi:hypothetical protein
MATQKKNKKNANRLDFNTINKASEKQFVTKEIEIIVDDKPYSVAIDTVFKTTKIEKLIDRLIKSDNLQQYSELEDSVKLGYYFYLIIREFTNLDIPDNLSLEQELVLIKNLIDLGIYSAILAEIPDAEIRKIHDYLHKFNMNLNEIKNGNMDELVVNSISVDGEDSELSDKDGE